MCFRWWGVQDSPGAENPRTLIYVTVSRYMLGFYANKKRRVKCLVKGTDALKNGLEKTRVGMEKDEDKIPEHRRKFAGVCSEIERRPIERRFTDYPANVREIMSTVFRGRSGRCRNPEGCKNRLCPRSKICPIICLEIRGHHLSQSHRLPFHLRSQSDDRYTL
ncbi:hypothetical protein TNCV_3980961 [Trichonephila clavipes]|nr:hypothetical protein TNCV_3980961 [Trichonephila clavipes]